MHMCVCVCVCVCVCIAAGCNTVVILQGFPYDPHVHVKWFVSLNGSKMG